MGKPKKGKSNIPFAKLIAAPSEPRLLNGQAPNFESKGFVYCLRNIDYKGPWGWNRLGRNELWIEVIEKLDNLQTMKWGEILNAAGGRSAGTNSHTLFQSDLNECAVNRLQEISRDDIPEIYSIRLSGKHRVYGTRREHFFDMLWFDDDHGENDNCVCRTNRTKN